METCPRCEGDGWRLWMDRGRARFLRCWICLGEGTVAWLLGAQARPPAAAHIVVRNVGRKLRDGRRR